MNTRSIGLAAMVGTIKTNHRLFIIDTAANASNKTQSLVSRQNIPRLGIVPFDAYVPANYARAVRIEFEHCSVQWTRRQSPVLRSVDDLLSDMHQCEMRASCNKRGPIGRFQVWSRSELATIDSRDGMNPISSVLNRTHLEQ
jgi:hypothetical protein